MNYKLIDNQFGGIVYFFSREFNECYSEAGIYIPDAKYARVVFLDNADESILPDIQLLPLTEIEIRDICFCNSNRKGINDAISLLKNNRVQEIFITPNCIYSCGGYDFRIGYENWLYSWAPNALHEYDSAGCVSDIADLVKKAGQIAETIAAFAPASDLEKIILTDAWIQKNIQYATGKESLADGGKYVCETITHESNVHDPILHGFGRCEDIALIAALILNHPTLGVHCRQVSTSRTDGFNHSWNIVTCNGNEYYTDFTHNISRNPHRANGALRATSYSYQFTLLGIKDAIEKYGTTDLYSSKAISQVSIGRKEIEETVQRLKHRGAMEVSWSPEPIIPSYFVANT